MYSTRRLKVAVLTSTMLAVSSQAADPASKAKTVEAAKGEKVLWQDPFGRELRNLLYGQGGPQHQPAGSTFEFLEEQTSGSTPKFKVVDAAGTRWKVKLGVEAKPETVATRLVWAAGYSTDEDYFLSEIHVTKLPVRLRRGQNYVEPGGLIRDARLERDNPGEKDAGLWKWKDDPFAGTKEWNGLRVLMSLINNWDLKDVNNSIYFLKAAAQQGTAGPRYVYVVSDLGASFGPVRLDMGRQHNKGELKSYRRSRFIRKTEMDRVSFASPAPPSLPIMIFNPFVYVRRRHMTWIGHDIPRSDARWMGSILAKLSPSQIRDAFRAGGYSPEEVEGFAVVVERRIAALNAL